MKTKLIKSVSGNKVEPFEQIDLYEIQNKANSSSKGFIQEVFLKNAGTNSGTIQYLKPAIEIFGTETPHSSNFLFHKMEKKQAGSKIPVLLVHGAGANAWIWCYDPIESISKDTLIFKLAENGFPTYAISSACPQGSNYFQAEHIISAIEIIKQETGKDKVNVIATGDGNIPVQLYLSSSTRYPWMRKYDNSVDKYIGLGSPNLGIDYQFDILLQA